MNVLKPKSAAASLSPFTESKALILKDIRSKWGKFDEDELRALTSNDDLIAQIADNYSLDKAQAIRDVDVVLRGRQL